MNAAGRLALAAVLGLLPVSGPSIPSACGPGLSAVADACGPACSCSGEACACVAPTRSADAPIAAAVAVLPSGFGFRDDLQRGVAASQASAPAAFVATVLGCETRPMLVAFPARPTRVRDAVLCVLRL